MESAFGVDHGEFSKREPDEHRIAIVPTTKKDRRRARVGNTAVLGTTGGLLGAMAGAEAGGRASLIGAGIGAGIGSGAGAAIRPAKYKAKVVPRGSKN